jgi:hypothetical protein
MNGNRQTSDDLPFNLFVAKEREELMRAVLGDADAPQAPGAEPQKGTYIPMPAAPLEFGATALCSACSKCGGHTHAVEIRAPEDLAWTEVNSDCDANLPKGKKVSGVNAPAIAATRGYVAGLECQASGTLLARCLARNAAHHAAAAAEIQFQ